MTVCPNYNRPTLPDIKRSDMDKECRMVCDYMITWVVDHVPIVRDLGVTKSEALKTMGRLYDKGWLRIATDLAPSGDFMDPDSRIVVELWDPVEGTYNLL